MMTGRITGVVVAAMLLGSGGIASAQIDRTGPTYSPNYTSYVSPSYNFYYNRHYWEELAPLAEFIGTPLRRQKL
jgi:hypothetical protein